MRYACISTFRTLPLQEFTVSTSSPVGGPSLSDARGKQVAEPLANFHGWLPGAGGKKGTRIQGTRRRCALSQSVRQARSGCDLLGATEAGSAEKLCLGQHSRAH